MSEECYRLFSVSLSCLTLALAVLLFVLAVMRDEMKLKLHRPDLDLEPHDFPNGEKTVLKVGTSSVPARYWHLQVFNRKPWFLGKNVELSLLHLSIRYRDSPEVERCLLSGALAIKEKRNSIRNDVGEKEVTFDLFRAVENRGISLLFADRVPNNLKPFLREAGLIYMTLQARGDNGLSNKLFIEVEWDGDNMVWESPADHIKVSCKTD